MGLFICDMRPLFAARWRITSSSYGRSLFQVDNVKEASTIISKLNGR